MKKILIILFAISYLLTFQLHGQQEIPILKKRPCDTVNSNSIIQTQTEKSRCLNWTKDEVLYFKSKKEFASYYKTNKIASDKCNDLEQIQFDFKKYDVLFIRVIVAGCGMPEHSFQTVDNNKYYSVNLNFVFQPIICAMGNIFYSYVLLPKGKKIPPAFTIYETFKKCY